MVRMTYMREMVLVMSIHEGRNDDPIEIETFLSTHPDILDVQIVSVPDPKHGEQLMAFVILKEGSLMSENDVHNFCEINDMQHKAPKYIEFTDEYPRTASGKIMRFKLRELAITKLSE